jgi:hypothetical protein
MRRLTGRLFQIVLGVLLAAFGPMPSARAHALPVSYLDIKSDRKGASVTLEASIKDWVREAPSLDGAALLKPQAGGQSARLLAMLSSRLQLAADGKPLRAKLRGATPLPEIGDVRLLLRYDWPAREPDLLQVRCRLFPRDPGHKTFLALYRGANLERQDIFDRNTPRIEVHLSSSADGPGATGIFAVVRRFIAEGIHHIFIGPDHILFIIGLLLLGGTLRQLLKIVTAFTIAHSFTLALATLGVLNPPARLVEPLIALSIVFVGAHDLFQLRANSNSQQTSARHQVPDVRLLFAFVFGLVHGFGFASVLRELELPRAALFYSLGAFNVGVELGQMCIVLSVAPLLALVGRRSRPIAGRIAFAGSMLVVAAGTFWLVQRVAFT